jgi:hypothetical protein
MLAAFTSLCLLVSVLATCYLILSDDDGEGGEE